MADMEQAGFNSQLISGKVCTEKIERVKGLPLSRVKPDYLTCLFVFLMPFPLSVSLSLCILFLERAKHVVFIGTS